MNLMFLELFVSITLLSTLVTVVISAKLSAARLALIVAPAPPGTPGIITAAASTMTPTPSATASP